MADAPVLIDAGKCVGCGKCVKGCGFGALSMADSPGANIGGRADLACKFLIMKAGAVSKY